MKKFIKRLSLIAPILFLIPIWFLPSTAEPTNLIQNGSFEQPQINQAWGLYTGVPSWRDGTFGGMLEIWNAPAMGLQAPDGNQILELNSTGQHEIKQDVIVTPNTNYLFSYWHKKRNYIEESSTAGIDGADYEITHSQCMTDNFDWNLCQLEFNSQDNYVITVIISPDSAGSMGNLIDNVSLFEIPGPTPTETIEPSPTIIEPTETIEPTATESTSEPTNSGSPTQTPEPTQTEVEPSPYPSPTQTWASPEPSILPSETLLPTPIDPSETISPSLSEFIEPSEVPIDIIPEEVKYVTLENGVILEEEVAAAVILLQDPKELFKAVFTNPGKAVKALFQVGKDLPPKKRKTAQRIVFPTLIVSSIISNVSASLLQRRSV